MCSFPTLINGNFTPERSGTEAIEAAAIIWHGPEVSWDHPVTPGSACSLSPPWKLVMAALTQFQCCAGGGHLYNPQLCTVLSKSHFCTSTKLCRSQTCQSGYSAWCGCALGQLWETPQSPRHLNLLSSPCFGSKQVCTHRVIHVTTPMSIPLTFKSTKDTCLDASVPEEGHPVWSSSFLLPREDLQAFAIPLILCVASQECMSQPSLLFPSYWFCVEHFYSLSYIGVFLPVSSLLLGKIIPHIDVFLIFSWRKVSSAFFYSTILISEAVFLLSNSLVSKSLSLFLFF